ncbi:MAG: radical SAM protein [Bacteroidaceae bacterium]|nr:radical SAM protein [Bacteroidaceae bacterium]
MSTVIYPSPVFGPVQSRRLGVSLGINLLPADGKVCSFDCIYCECGLNAEHRPKRPLPTIEELETVLEETLEKMKAEGRMPDVLTFAGNGEPTMHPRFPEAVDCAIRLRDRFCPKAKISVLSNSTRIHKPEVREALMRVDNNILKLDTVNQEYIQRTDQPQGSYDVEKVIEDMCRFEGNCIVQTLFMQGESEGVNYDNTSAQYVEPWIAALQRIQPSQVMIYTIDRETPVQGLKKATPEQLDGIAAQVRALGFDVSVSY